MTDNSQVSYTPILEAADHLRSALHVVQYTEAIGKQYVGIGHFLELIPLCRLSAGKG